MALAVLFHRGVVLMAAVVAAWASPAAAADFPAPQSATWIARDFKFHTGKVMPEAWLWGVNGPDFMDALGLMASQPTEIASRNWMLRRLITDSIRNDPEWNGGNYTAQPKSARFASVFFGIAINGGTLPL